MNQTLEILKIFHHILIALCALLGAFVGLAMPYAMVGWAIWSNIT